MRKDLKLIVALVLALILGLLLIHLVSCKPKTCQENCMSLELYSESMLKNSLNWQEKDEIIENKILHIEKSFLGNTNAIVYIKTYEDKYREINEYIVEVKYNACEFREDDIKNDNSPTYTIYEIHD